MNQNDRVNIEYAGRQLQGRMDEGLKELLGQESIPERRRLLKLFYERQRSAMGLLQLVHVDVETPTGKPIRLAPWEKALAHPLTEMVLLAALLGLVAAKAFVPGLICAGLALVRCLLVYGMRRERSGMPTVSEPYLLRHEMDRFLIQQENGIQIDVGSIAGLSDQKVMMDQKSSSAELVRVFTALYEAQVDQPENQELAYCLNVVRAALYRMDMVVEDYAPGAEALFEVIDDAGVNQMRCPAIVRKDGTLVHRGLYLTDAKTEERTGGVKV